MDVNFYINSVVLFLVLSYGISFAFMNWVKWGIVLITPNSTFNQSSMGKFLDVCWLLGIAYFFTYGKPFILEVIKYV